MLNSVHVHELKSVCYRKGKTKENLKFVYKIMMPWDEYTFRSLCCDKRCHKEKNEVLPEYIPLPVRYCSIQSICNL
jgi:hypothetical protein